MVENAALDPHFQNNPRVTGGSGIRFYAGTTRDLADLTVAELERLRAERLLKERVQILDMAEAMSGVGHWKADLTTGAVLWSEEVYVIYGVARARFEPAIDRSMDAQDHLDLHQQIGSPDRFDQIRRSASRPSIIGMCRSRRTSEGGVLARRIRTPAPSETSVTP